MSFDGYIAALLVSWLTGIRFIGDTYDGPEWHRAAWAGMIVVWTALAWFLGVWCRGKR